MPLIPTTDATVITGRLAQMLTDTADLWDAASPRARTAQNAPCHVLALADPTVQAATERGEVIVLWRILLPPGTDVQPEWQVRMSATTATPSLANRTFVVRGDLPGSGERIRRVIAVESQ